MCLCMTNLGMSVPDRLPRHKYETQPKICDAGRHVRLDEDVLALEVSVRDGWLNVERAFLRELLVQVRQTRCHRMRNLAHLGVRHCIRLEKVAK